MSTIQIKGINDYLLFILNDEVGEEVLLCQLQEILSSPSFKKENYFPKAYFDFGCREVNELFFLKFLTLLDQVQTVLFCGIQGPRTHSKELLCLKKEIRNGEVYEVKEDCILEGKINPGGKLLVYGNLYLMGSCFGEIELCGQGVVCSSSQLNNATITINGIRKEALFSSELCTIWEDGNTIVMK